MKNVNKTIRTLRLLTMSVSFVAALLTGVGCEFKNPFVKKANTGPASPLPLEQEEAENFQGYFLTVKIDGFQAEKLKIEGNEQIWTVLKCSPTPTIMFEMNENKLGPLKIATININPLINGKPDRQDIWLYAGKDAIEPSQEIRLNSFNHFSDGKMIAGIKELPTGKYRLSLQVNGEDTWDRQFIDFEIK